jgi:hypothetical protein
LAPDLSRRLRGLELLFAWDFLTHASPTVHDE